MTSRVTRLQNNSGHPDPRPVRLNLGVLQKPQMPLFKASGSSEPTDSSLKPSTSTRHQRLLRHPLNMDDDSSKIEATPRTLVLCLDGTVGKFDSDVSVNNVLLI